MIRAALECDCFHVTFTAKKVAAMSLLSSLKIDLVVADVCLPDGLGTEVARYAGSLKIPVTLMTGHPRHMAEFDRTGADISRSRSGSSSFVRKCGTGW
jgi:DNA-binding response OmpR family regulator